MHRSQEDTSTQQGRGSGCETLLCVTGLSPQIITETLYGLIQRDGKESIPERIVVITTERGADLIHNALIDAAGPRHLGRLLEDHGLESSAADLSVDDIRVIQDSRGDPLDDIRTRADNEATADLICRVVQDLTDETKGPLHASIAGGRKSMGFYLGHAMSLFARPFDEISHVLVEAPFEGHPEFYFPPSQPAMLQVQDGQRSRLVRADRAQITLAPIPIVRLRESLPPELVTGQASYTDAVALAQTSLARPFLIIDVEKRLICCSGKLIRLSGAPFGLLAWMADRIRRGLGGVRRCNIEEHQDDIAFWRARVTGTHSGSTEGLEQALERGSYGMNEFDSTKSRLKRKLREQLGSELARHFWIEPEGGVKNRPMTLNLEADQIEFGDLTDEKESIR